jgi:surfactin synthase thioesterase subunit
LAFDGVDDPLTFDDQVEGWAAQTSGAFTLHKLPGDHFFLDSQKRELLDLIARHLTSLDAAARPAAS